MRGLIVKGIGGFYYVRTEEGVIQTRGRGILRNESITPTVGDLVEIEKLSDGDGVLNAIEPRRNIFSRPPIANVDVVVIVFSATKPKPNFELIDRFLIMAESKGVEAILCMNKTDLVKEKKAQELIARYQGLYPLVLTSGQEGIGVEKLAEMLVGRTAALAGASGVGKSTLINQLVPEASMETSGISKKTNRGRHTTRHVEILDLPGGGMVFDTPGFTSFDIKDVESADLWKYYPEIAKYQGECRFDNCTHTHEPQCRVRQAVEEGEIRQERYDSYVRNYNDMKENERKRYG